MGAVAAARREFEFDFRVVSKKKLQRARVQRHASLRALGQTNKVHKSYLRLAHVDAHDDARMTLEERSIAAYREKLLRCKAYELSAEWEKSTLLKGGNSNVVFETQHRRDVLAYTMIRSAELNGCYVFGGFVRAHCSGKPWNDIDVLVPSGRHEDDVWVDMLKMILFVLPLSNFDLRQRVLRKSESYAKKYSVTTNDVTIRVDMMQVGRTSASPHTMLPVTVGSCLQMKSDTITIRNVPNIGRHLSTWHVTDIVQMLRNGEDMKLCPNLSAAMSQKFLKEYGMYYWVRISQMAKTWTLHEANEEEPATIDADKLSAIIAQMSTRNVHP